MAAINYRVEKIGPFFVNAGACGTEWGYRVRHEEMLTPICDFRTSSENGVKFQNEQEALKAGIEVVREMCLAALADCPPK